MNYSKKSFLKVKGADGSVWASARGRRIVLLHLRAGGAQQRMHRFMRDDELVVFLIGLGVDELESCLQIVGVAGVYETILQIVFGIVDDDFRHPGKAGDDDLIALVGDRYDSLDEATTNVCDLDRIAHLFFSFQPNYSRFPFLKGTLS